MFQNKLKSIKNGEIFEKKKSKDQVLKTRESILEGYAQRQSFKF